MKKPYSISASQLSAIFISIFAGLALWTCAAVAPPSGGPKDETPPELLSVIPESGTTRFSGESIELVFSEYLLETSAEKAIQVFPRLKDPVAVSFKGERLMVHWPDSLQENQTYILTVGRTLQDEHNVPLAETIQLAYSTGDSIDRGSISGHVYAAKEMAVHLWSIQEGESPDSVLFREADYVTETNALGEYSFQFLSGGVYQICSIGLEMAGQILDPMRTSYGLYWEEAIPLEPNETNIGINMISSREEPPLRVTKSDWVSPVWGRVHFSSVVIPEDVSMTLFSEDSIAEEDIPVFHDPLEDNILIVETDSLQQSLVDLGVYIVRESGTMDTTLLTVRVPLEPDTSLLTIVEPSGTVSIKPETGTAPDITIIFSQPVRFKDEPEQAITLVRQDTIPVELAVIQEGPMDVVLRMIDPWKENDTYLLTVDSSEVMGINGRGMKSSTLSRKIITRKRQGYGGVLGTISVDGLNNPLVQIRSMENSENHHTSDVNSASGFSFDKVPSGQYMLMIFDDINGDRNYTPGRARPYQVSEWFYMRGDTIDVRTNWDTELDPIMFQEQ